VILFAALKRMTGARWPSAFVAFLFALHPLHVESVAWISERKDVLSTLFLMLCLLSYERYVRAPGRRIYLIVMVLFALGLMSKPMIVTLPCIMLLLDAWPLQRMRTWRDVRRCVVEKIPMFALALASAVVTYIVQSTGRSVAPIAKLPLVPRVANALVAYGRYLQLTFVPRGLAVFYPLTAATLDERRAIVTTAILAAITIVAVVLRRRQPWLLVGWLWYLGTLVPVIGLVQVGSQSHADRYTYVPLIGIFLAIAWCARSVANRWPSARMAVAICAIATLVGVILLTWRQIGYWRNALTLMQHSADVVPNNYVALACLGEAYDRIGDHDTAARLYQETLQVRPGDAMALNNLALQAAARRDDETARKLYRESIFGDPNYAPAYNNYGNILMRLGERDEAIQVYRAGMKRDPDLVPLQHDLALALAEEGKLAEAIALWRRALAIDPAYAEAHESLGNGLILRGQTHEGITELRAALRLQPQRVGALKSLAWVLATHPSALYQNAAEAQELAGRAVRLAPDDPVALDTLAAAEARGGGFKRAIQNARRAASLARANHQDSLLEQINRRVELYRSGQPYTSH
jgi:tetratricopeptide (TPR) repeat protein